ncbi:hypothetical protein ACFXTO_015201 [Malus domestica]
MNGTVYMRDDNPCTTKGIGSIRIKHHDGVIRELHGVRYVPNLKKKLISLGTLESQGFKFYSDNNVLKVVKGALVIIKVPQNGLLYILQGSTLENGVVVVADEVQSDKNDLSALWLMRFGHVGSWIYMMK